MHKAVESALLVLFALAVYAGVPVLTVWGWVRWSTRTQPRTLFSILSLIGFTLATASGLLAVSSVLYAHAIGGFPFYDPRRGAVAILPRPGVTFWWVRGSESLDTVQ